MSDEGCIVCGAFVGHADACPAYIEELKARLSAALDETQMFIEKCEDLQSRLSATESWRDSWKERCKRAEVVVEAARQSQWPSIKEAIRQYEEGRAKNE